MSHHTLHHRTARSACACSDSGAASGFVADSNRPAIGACLAHRLPKLLVVANP